MIVFSPSNDDSQGDTSIMSRTILGKTEKQVVGYLVSHPNQLIQQIQEGLQQKNYQPVFNAIKTLVKKGLVRETESHTTQKGRVVLKYSLTDLGLTYVIAFEEIPPSEQVTGLRTILENYPGQPYFKLLHEVITDLETALDHGFDPYVLKIAARLHLTILEEARISKEQLWAIAAEVLFSWLKSQQKLTPQQKTEINEILERTLTKFLNEYRVSK
jgi:DNA-binding PadR family transcriptional regulator